MFDPRGEASSGNYTCVTASRDDRDSASFVVTVQGERIIFCHSLTLTDVNRIKYVCHTFHFSTMLVSDVWIQTPTMKKKRKC